MTTVNDIVTRALKKIGVVARDEAPEAYDIAEGVVAFNSMVHAWKLRGADFEHTDAAASDPFPFDPEFEEGTVYILASRLSPDYMIPPSFDADDWFRTFQAAKTTIPDSVLETALTDLPSRRARDGTLGYDHGA